MKNTYTENYIQTRKHTRTCVCVLIYMFVRVRSVCVPGDFFPGEFQLGCVDRTHGSIVGAFSLKQYVDEIMDDMLPDDAYKNIGDRHTHTHTHIHTHTHTHAHTRTHTNSW